MNKPNSQPLKVDKSTNLASLIEKYPEANEMLFEYGLYCGACFAAGFDTLEQGAQLHGMSETDVEELVEYLNVQLAENPDKHTEK